MTSLIAVQVPKHRYNQFKKKRKSVMVFTAKIDIAEVVTPAHDTP